MCFTHSDIVQNKIAYTEYFFCPQNYYMFILCIVLVKCNKYITVVYPNVCESV